MTSVYIRKYWQVGNLKIDYIVEGVIDSLQDIVILKKDIKDYKYY